MRTFSEVLAWCDGAAEAYGDPAAPVCQLFVRWCDDLERYVARLEGAADGELACGLAGGRPTLVLGPAFHLLPLPIQKGAPELEGGDLVMFGAKLITRGVWALAPSLNVPGLIHGFVILYDVPEPAPWERRIVLPSGVRL